MSGTLTPRYSKEEFARRGEEIYERDILPHLKGEDEDKFVLIDIESGDFELDWEEMAASDRLFARRPDAQIWFRRVGNRPVRRFGYHRQVAEPRVGDTVEVIVLAAPERRRQETPYPLRGTPIRYDDPTEPVAESDWDVLKSPL